MRRFLLILLLLLIPQTVHAAQPSVFKVWGAANAVWFDDNAKPSDFELGATVAASLSEHISLTGAAFGGLDHKYIRAVVGPRISLSAGTGRNISVGLGVEYQASNKTALRPNEWAATTSLGWRPLMDYSQVVIGVQGSYGMQSNTGSYMAALRYRFGGN